MPPKLTVAITGYNRGNYLQRNIDSIVNQGLNKELYEIVFVDNGSDDGTEDIMKILIKRYKNKANIRFFRRDIDKKAEEDKPGNIMIAKNITIKQARGEIIMFTDTEVLHNHNTLQLMLYNQDKAKNLFVVGKVYSVPSKQVQRDINQINSFDKVISFIEELDKKEGFFSDKFPKIRSGTENRVCFPFLCSVRKKWLMKIGGYDEDFIGIGHEDTDLWDRLYATGIRPFFDDNILGIHCWHESHWNNATGNSEIMEKKREQIIRNEGKEWGKL